VATVVSLPGFMEALPEHMDEGLDAVRCAATSKGQAFQADSLKAADLANVLETTLPPFAIVAFIR